MPTAIRSNFAVYDSIHEFVKAPYCWALSNYFTNDFKTSKWAGGRSYAQSQMYFLHGAGEYELREARELMEKIDVEVHGHTGEVWKPQVYGAYPMVADYLAGDPLCMRAKEVDEVDSAPLRVVLNITVAAGMNQGTIARRAAAAAAFAMKLSERRPVELWASCAVMNENLSTDVGYRIKLDMPMNLSQVIAAFNPSVCRMLSIPICETLSQMGNAQAPPSNDSYSFTLKGFSAYEANQRADYMKALRQYQKLDDNDIVLDAGILTDCAAIDENPVQWVKDMLVKYGEATED